MKQEVIPTDIYEDSDLIKIEFNTPDGEFVVDAEWDINDEQTSENRTAFRKWAYNFVNDSLKYKVRV